MPARAAVVTSVQRMPRGSPPPEPGQRPYKSQGHLRRFWPSKARELVVSGPAGTGKSRAILERIYGLACKYPGLRVLICRKTRASLTESALDTFERYVVSGTPPWLTNQKRRVRQSYVLPNGSDIVVTGLDNPDRILSTEFDLIYVQEAREIVEGDWEILMSRLRSQILPWRAIWGDTNPDGPSHWILERERAGKITLVPTIHEDNPRLYNAEAEQWTAFGEEYLATLDDMTGMRKARLRWGKWVGGENLVYEDWDPSVHVISQGDFKKYVKDSWKRDLTVDFGFTSAFCALWSAEDPEGRLYFYRELYGTQRKTRDWAHEICQVGGPDNERLRWIITDHARADRLELERHMLHTAAECPDPAESKEDRDWDAPAASTTPAIKSDESYQIQLVQSRLARAGDGFPRLFVVKGMRANPRDDRLVEQKAPTCLEEEFPRYEWARARSLTAGEVTLETPVDRWNHALDCVKYRVAQSDAHLDPRERTYGKSFGERVG
jgi:hypothetical protein